MRSHFALAALAAAASAHVAPRQTMAPNVVPEMLKRQDSVTAAPSASATSFVTRTYAYYSAGNTEGLVLWAPITYASELFTFTSSGDFWRGCSRTYYQTIGTSVTFDTHCPMFTTCSDGWLVAESTSYYCVAQTLSCFTEILYQTYGDPKALSWLYCGSSSANATNTSYYRTKPPADVPATTTTPASTDSSATSTTASITTPTGPANTDPPENKDGGGKKSNTGAIAGGVVGGVAALAIAAVAIFWIMRRNKKKNAAAAAGTVGSAGPAAGAAGPYPTENKPPANVDVGGYYPPEGQHSPPQQHDPAKYQQMYDPNQGQMGVGQGGYNPHQMYPGGSASPPPMSAGTVPPYEPPQGGQHQYRNELPS